MTILVIITLICQDETNMLTNFYGYFHISENLVFYVLIEN